MPGNDVQSLAEGENDSLTFSYQVQTGTRPVDVVTRKTIDFK